MPTWKLTPVTRTGFLINGLTYRSGWVIAQAQAETVASGVVLVVVVVYAQRQELKCSRLAPGYFTLNGDKAPPAARDSSEVARS